MSKKRVYTHNKKNIKKTVVSRYGKYKCINSWIKIVILRKRKRPKKFLFVVLTNFALRNNDESYRFQLLRTSIDYLLVWISSWFRIPDTIIYVLLLT